MTYVIAIPSYKRPDVLKEKTIATLENHKIPKSIVYIFVANKDEEKEYKALFSDYRIVVGRKGLLEQRNFMTKYFPIGKNIVYMDDDISDIYQVNNEGKKTSIHLNDFLQLAFNTLDDKGLYIWGIYPVNNPYYMKRTVSTDLKFILGTFYGVKNRHDRDIMLHFESQKEDTERTLRYFHKDGGVVRFNYVGIKTVFYAKGGMEAEYGSVEDRLKEDKQRVERLLKEFPMYGSIKQRPNGIWEFVFKRGALRGGVAPPHRDLGDEETDTEIYRPKIRNETKYKEARDRLLEVLRRTTITPIQKATKSYSRGNIIGNIGRSMTLGFGQMPRFGVGQFRKNKKHPELLEALVSFGNRVVPKGYKYSAITVNEGVKAKKHKDGKNGGLSFIIGLGDYEGGELRVWDAEDKNPHDYDLKDKPLGFNGSLLYHQTTPFEGERYTIIFYNQMWEGEIEGLNAVGMGREC